jgi:hypothetical protein
VEERLDAEIAMEHPKDVEDHLESTSASEELS